MNEYKPPTQYICPHLDCERGMSKSGCPHYGKHPEHDYCKYPCPKNGATCITVDELERLIEEQGK